MGFGDKSLTWQQAAAVPVVIAGLASVVIAYGQGDDLDTIRHVGRYGIAVAAPLTLFLVWAHHRAIRRADEMPDILGQIFPAEQLFQAGKTHLWFSAFQSGRALRVVVVAQNMKAGAGTVDVVLTRKAFVETEQMPELPRALKLDLPGASVVVADVCIALPPEARGNFKAYVEARSRAAGRQVRFARRQIVTKHISEGFSVGLSLTGGSIGGGGLLLEIPIAPLVNVSTDRETLCHGWRAEAVWLPEDPAPVEQVWERLAAKLEESAD